MNGTVGTNLGILIGSAEKGNGNEFEKTAFTFLTPEEIAERVKIVNIVREKEEARSRKAVEQRLHKERVAQEISGDVQQLKVYITRTLAAFGVWEIKNIQDKEVRQNLQQAQNQLEKLQEQMEGTDEKGRMEFRALNEFLQKSIFCILFHKEEGRGGEIKSVLNELTPEAYHTAVDGLVQVIEQAVVNDNLRPLPWTGQVDGKTVFACFDRRQTEVIPPDGVEVLDLKKAARVHETIVGVGKNANVRYWAWRYATGSKVVGFMKTARMCRQALFDVERVFREKHIAALKKAQTNPRGLREGIPGRYIISYSKWGVGRGRDGDRKEVRTFMDITLSEDGVVTFNGAGPGFGRYRGTNPALEDLLADRRFFKFLILAGEEEEYDRQERRGGNNRHA